MKNRFIPFLILCILLYGCSKAPIAEFEAMETSVSACDTIIFADLSSNTPTSWLWDFGDGGSSTEQNPNYNYSDEGIYSVSLTATNEAGDSPPEIKTDYIEVSGNGCPKAPVADFEALGTSVSACDTIIFTDLSLNTPTSWLWDFGDGESSTEQNPIHTYTDEGFYSISLTATNEVGESPSEIKTDYIEVSGNCVTDLEGNIYKAVTIGTQTWMAENLATTSFNDGSAIPLVTDSDEWFGLSTPACCWWENDEITYKSQGVYYNFYTVENEKLCPDGWHMSTIEEWTILRNYLGVSPGNKLKSTTGWMGDGNGSDDYGFRALPTGVRTDNYSPEFLGKGTNFITWTSSKSNSQGQPFFIQIYHNSDILEQNDTPWLDSGMPVRCVKD